MKASSHTPSVISVIFMPQFALRALACVLSLQHAPMQCTLRGLLPLHVRATCSLAWAEIYERLQNPDGKSIHEPGFLLN